MLDLHEGILAEFAERSAQNHLAATEWAWVSIAEGRHKARANQYRCPAKHREDMRERRSDPGYRERERKAQAKRRRKASAEARRRAARIEACKARARAKRLQTP